MNNRDLFFNRKHLNTRDLSLVCNVSLGYASKNKNYTPPLKVDNAIILAAGRGSRMGSLTNDLPKPLIQVNGIPIIETSILNLIEVNIKNIYIVVGYKSHAFDGLIKKYPFIKLIKNDE
jgi:hypothetical protein